MLMDQRFRTRRQETFTHTYMQIANLVGRQMRLNGRFKPEAECVA